MVQLLPEDMHLAEYLLGTKKGSLLTRNIITKCLKSATVKLYSLFTIFNIYKAFTYFFV